jgi:hypothetical protein
VYSIEEMCRARTGKTHATVLHLQVWNTFETTPHVPEQANK